MLLRSLLNVLETSNLELTALVVCVQIPSTAVSHLFSLQSITLVGVNPFALDHGRAHCEPASDDAGIRGNGEESGLKKRPVVCRCKSSTHSAGIVHPAVSVTFQPSIAATFPLPLLGERELPEYSIIHRTLLRYLTDPYIYPHSTKARVLQWRLATGFRVIIRRRHVD